MSLHLANLSPRMRKDELERIFKSFGRCTVQLKDGYGFAVYDFRGDAEKALRTLKGRKICGESIYLSWSNKQPKPLQRAARSHDVRYGIHSDQGDDFVGRRGYLMSDKKQPDKGRERHKSPEIHDDRHRFNLNDAGRIHYDQREVVLEEGGRVVIKPNQIDDGRWGEQVDNLRNDTGYDAQRGFDRYDPGRVDEKGEEYDNHGLDHFAGSHSVRTSPDKNRRVHPDGKRGQQTCFKCGAVGHKMRDCSSKEALQEKNTYHPYHRHDVKAKNEVERAQIRSGGRLQSCCRNSKSARQPDIHGKISHSEKDGVKHSPVENESGWDKRKNNNRDRQRESDDQIVESHDDKKKRVSALSHLHSDCASPELGRYSRPSKPLGGLSSHFKNGSPRSHSLSARSRSYSRSRRSRSHSRSHRSRSNSRSRRSRSNSKRCRSRSNIRLHRSRSRSIKIKSRSRSRSRSPSSSLSISIGRSLLSSPNKAEGNLNAYSEGGPSPLSRDAHTEVRQHDEPEICEENLSIANKAERSLSRCMDNLTSYQIMDVPIERRESEHNSDIMTSTKHTEESLNGFGEDDQIPQYQDIQEAMLEENQWLEPQQNFEPPQADAPLGSKCISTSEKMIDGMKLDKVLTDTDSDSTVPHVLCDLEAPSSSLLEKGDGEYAAVNISAAELKETEELENANVETTKSLEPINDTSDLEASPKSHVGSRLSISAEELSRVMKCYDLKHPEENEQHLDVGDYFGSSRLWPWEIIYYRRLKKGLISMENYARRVAQNEAFHITDKYIRSSSGWE
ncbi:serine/arginine-rich splicing factor 4-like [Chenopodium quinoa]|uniref:serine/arginine-rich splicing factor 4-like n=1 Tax=Chenopodium quinoa TaxID=63459 RepID=UPI000B797DA5|nr:serine/arginine-rich splicing factor 4-like [Chenopodium quinoa]